MRDLPFTPLSEIPQIFDTLQKTYRSRVSASLAWRRTQLYQLARMVQENADQFADAIYADLGKPHYEAYGQEIFGMVHRALKSARLLEEWSKEDDFTADVADWQKGWKPKVFKQPKGVVLVIAPWNYPMALSIQPVIAAMAAGCPAVLKPSEISPHFSALCVELFPRYLDQNAYRAVNGGKDEASKLLECRWAHIFYTGNGRVGRIIAAAAAKHLIPCTLELGGKSPVIVDVENLNEEDLDTAARRIMYAKCTNAGQICISPDYVLVSRAHQVRLIAALKKAHDTFFPLSEENKSAAFSSSSYGSIVSKSHFRRLKSLLDRTKGSIAFGGGMELDAERRIEPTVVADVQKDDSLMEEEIFGPILPIFPVENLDEAIDHINDGDNPLALYVFTQNEDVKEKIKLNTLSGSIVFNDAFSQTAVDELPFGGVGESGYGLQIMRYGFEGFTHHRTSIDVPYAEEKLISNRYAPYSKEALDFFKQGVQQPIPPPEVKITGVCTTGVNGTH